MKRKEIDAIKAEALRLADELERDLCEYHCDAVALVLRRLHAENETLRAGYDAARLEIESLKAQSEGAQQPDTAYAALPDAPTASYAMVDAYLKAQREAVEEADRFGRPNIGGLHTNTVREACRAGLNAALEADRASHGQAPAQAAPAAVAELVVNRATVIEWLDANDIEVTDRQMDGLFHSAAAPTPSPASQGDALDAALDAFENKERGILQAHIAAALVAELRAAIDAASTTQEGKR